MKALTICQPWAWAIVHGPKRIENRTWWTNYRGMIAIHAGKSRKWLEDRLNDGTPVKHDELVFGAIIGVANLWHCCRVERLQKPVPFGEGPFCWLLADVTALARPYEIAGQRGLWDVDIPDEYMPPAQWMTP